MEIVERLRKAFSRGHQKGKKEERENIFSALEMVGIRFETLELSHRGLHHDGTLYLPDKDKEIEFWEKLGFSEMAEFLRQQ